MTRHSSALVSGASNARYAAFLGLHRFLALDPKGLREGAQHTPAILADVFEVRAGGVWVVGRESTRAAACETRGCLHCERLRSAAGQRSTPRACHASMWRPPAGPPGRAVPRRWLRRSPRLYHASAGRVRGLAAAGRRRRRLQGPAQVRVLVSSAGVWRALNSFMG